MPAIATSAELLDSLKGLAIQQGLTLHTADGTRLEGSHEAIKAKWFLGANKSVYSFSCALDDATRTVRFRESILDRSWGLPPPSFKVESYSQSGTKVTSTKTQKGIGGGGNLDFGAWREICAQATVDAGWQFNHEAMRAP